MSGLERRRGSPRGQMARGEPRLRAGGPPSPWRSRGESVVDARLAVLLRVGHREGENGDSLACSINDSKRVASLGQGRQHRFVETHACLFERSDYAAGKQGRLEVEEVGERPVGLARLDTDADAGCADFDGRRPRPVLRHASPTGRSPTSSTSRRPCFPAA